MPSKCVTIPRSLDGRLQVSHRKALPHVIYCRVWRWPDLQSHHELKPLSCCQFPFSSKQNEVCINPFHYERVEAAVLPPVLVPKYIEYFQGFSVLHENNNQQQQQQQPQQRTNCYTPDMYQQNSYSMNISYNYQMSFSNQQHLNSSPTFTSSSSTSMNATDDVDMYSPLSSDNSQNTSSEMPVSTSTSISYQQPTHWCTIAYYEINTRVGEMFHISSSRLHIDGYTDPSSLGRRVCLGILSNVHRNATIENTRRYIGKGII